jgi:diacylglycerol kinase family enzyme
MRLHADRDEMNARMDVVAIVNPISGAGMDPAVAGRRIERLERELGRRRLLGEIHVTTGPGHATEIARAARAAGAALVLVWGGDGTVNEAGGALVGGATALGPFPPDPGMVLPRRSACRAGPTRPSARR